VRVDVVDPLKMFTLSATIALLSILKIRAAVVEVTQVTISLGKPVPQILHLVRQDPFLLSNSRRSAATAASTVCTVPRSDAECIRGVSTRR
jgi:hypothetical protein